MSSRGRKRGRSQDDAYDRFSDKVDKPLTVLALLWLPVLVVPLVAPLTAPVAETFEAIDYFIWGLFAAEYVVKLYLSPSRSGYFSHHLLELAVVAVPMLRPLKTLSLAKLLQASKAGVVLAYALS